MVNLCGARTRSGGTCRSKPMPNGRCRMHGGGSTGPKDKDKHRQSMQGNKNSLKTGEYEQIWFDSLEPADIRHYELTPTEAINQLDHEIKLADIRERRMMERIRAAGKGKGRQRSELLLKIEEALTRVQAAKSRLIDLKIRLQETAIGKGENGSLDQFVEILAKARAAYQGNIKGGEAK